MPQGHRTVAHAVLGASMNGFGLKRAIATYMLDGSRSDASRGLVQLALRSRILGSKTGRSFLKSRQTVIQ